MEIIMIEWNDPCSIDNWHERGYFGHTTPCVSCGIKTNEDEEDIEVSLNLNLRNKSDCISIPKGSIRRIRRLKVESVL